MSDWDFIFDGVFGFLSSPLWMVPIVSFIEAESVVFEASEENYLAWTDVHKKYSSLVESLLSSFLKDMGITEEQFIQACKSSGAQNNPGLQPIFTQLQAAEDFEVFKTMMIQKNVELQLQALELIRKRQGVKKEEKPSKKKDEIALPAEEEILKEVIRKSALEYENEQKKRESETKTYNVQLEKEISESHDHVERLEKEVLLKQKETEQVIKESIEQSSSASSSTVPPEATAPTVETKSKPIESDRENKATNAALKQQSVSSPIVQSKSPSPSTNDKPGSSTETESPEDRHEPSKPTDTSQSKLTTSKKSDAAAAWLQNAQMENKNTASNRATQQPNKLNHEDSLAQRAEYLKQQRDRLLALKKQEREKQLTQYTNTQTKKQPTSARVAKESVTGEINVTPSPSDKVSNATSLSAADAKRMAMRKALAEKLKKEVIYK